MTAEAARRPGPFGEAALALWAAGWRGVLPLPERSKANPPSGYTGAQGGWPSYADVHAWTEGREADGNVCLRLPQHVLGVDVDDYADKRGAATLAAAVERWGDLPATWTITSREGASGIRLFTVPEHLHWPGELPGGDVELLQYRHRYAVAPPSLHPEGRRYRWQRPDGTTSLTAPPVDDLPLLPQRWVDGLTAGRAAADVARAGVDRGGAGAWLAAHDGTGRPCPAVRAAARRALLDLRAGSRHDGALRATMRLASLAAERHSGAVAALGDVHAAFLTACADARRGTVRSPETTAHEWLSLLVGAVDVAAAQPEVIDPTDPCENPLAGLLPREAGPSWSVPSTPAATPATPGPSVSSPPFSAPGSAPAAPSSATTGAPTTDRTADPTSSAWTAAGDRLDTDALADLGVLSLDQQQVAAMAAAQRERERAMLVEVEVERLRARREAQRVLDEEEAARWWRDPPSRFTLADELALPDEPVQYVVDDLVPTGANVLLTAQFKAGKTTLSNNLAAALADGEPFLGRFGVHRLPGRVALWNYEVDERQYRRWLRSAGIGHPERVAVLNLRGQVLDLTSRIGAEYAVRWLGERECSAWCLDPFARAFKGESENDNSEVGRWLDAVDVIKQRAGVDVLWLPVHTGRGEQQQGAERARGATRLDDWADVRWLLVRDPKSDERYLRATGRDVEVDEGRLTFDPLSRRLHWSEGGRGDKSASELQATMLAAVEASPGIGTNGIEVYCRNVLGSLSKERLRDGLRGLVSQGVVVTRPGPRSSTLHYLPSAL